MTYSHPGSIDNLFLKRNLSTNDTRSTGDNKLAAVCACGELDGALYYGLKHNRTAKTDTAIVIEFEAEENMVAVDGKDFLYTVFQMGDPDRALPVLCRSFGKAVERYAARAWQHENQDVRVALCDLAVYDPAVIQAHHANDVVLRGRHGTIFRNAFVVKLPIVNEAVIRVWSPACNQRIPSAEVSFRDLLLDRGEFLPSDTNF